MNKKGKRGIFSIQNKMVICFMVPIAFMILLGTLSYKKAASGMSDTFRDSTQQTINMALEYIDISSSFIEAEALKYVVDSDLSKYTLGLYDDDPNAKRTIVNRIKNDILASQVGNEFVNDIHIITDAERAMISTRSASHAGIYDQYMEELGTADGKVNKWEDRHDALDEYLGVNSNDYIMTCQLRTQDGRVIVVVDVKTDALLDLLAGLDLGDGSIIGLVTSGGREVAVLREPGEELGEEIEEQIVFADKEFYLQASEEATVEEVVYEGRNYLFFHSKSDMTGATICALVPTSIVTSQAEPIKEQNIIGVIISCVNALLIGVWITRGIRKNMERISGSMEVVAEGNLATQVVVRGRDEFQGLATAANNMIENNKQLVQKVSMATERLAASAEEVTEASVVIQEYSEDIANAINEINDGMEKQSLHAQECVAKTDTLSEEIQHVNAIAHQVEALVENAEKMIRHGMELITVLGERARETTEVTAQVEASILELKKESEIIDQFVGMITDISGQTNLLSLNASIEAARAGEAGRGFAVVAEEIRKLADNSAEAAGEIRNNVEHISAQTVVSVESAKKAGSMVALQTEAVQEVTGVFQNMNQAMEDLFESLKQILAGTEQADRERQHAMEAVHNISLIIEETAQSAEVVKNVAENLQLNVETLNGTADGLGENMAGLKNEIAVFKTE